MRGSSFVGAAVYIYPKTGDLVFIVSCHEDKTCGIEISLEEWVVNITEIRAQLVSLCMQAESVRKECSLLYFLFV